MSIVFSNPGLLWGLLAIAIPLVIHLLLRRQPRIEHWGASRFLKKVLQQNQTRLHVQSLSQLIVRILAVLLMFLAAANPRSDADRSAMNTPGNTHHLLIIDVSLSMAASVDGQSRLDLARQQILSFITQHAYGDSWQILLHGTDDDPIRIRIPSFEPEIVSDEVSQLSPTFQSADLGETLQRAITLIDEFPGNHNEILFFTDLPAADWDLTGSNAYELGARLEQLSNYASIAIIDVGKHSADNITIQDLQIGSSEVKIGETVPINVSLKNHSQSEAKSFLRLTVNSEPVAEQQVEFQPGAMRNVRFEVVLTHPGMMLCTAQIAEDSLNADNRRTLAFPVRDVTRVLIVDAPPAQSEQFRQSDFLQLALQQTSSEVHSLSPASRPSPYTIVIASPSQFRSLSLDEFDVLIICGLGNVNEFDAQQLEEFVSAGGGVLMTMGDSVSASEYNQHFGPQGKRLIPFMLRQKVSMNPVEAVPFQIGQIADQHPLVAPFLTHPDAGLSTTRIYAYYQGEFEDSKQGKRLVDLKTNDPLIVENSFGQGKVYVVTTAFDIEWGSWVLWPSFLPLVQRAVDHLSQRDSFIVHSVIGEPIPDSVVQLNHFTSIQNTEKQVVWDRQIGYDTLEEIFVLLLNSPEPYFFERSRPQKTRQIVLRQVDTKESDLRHMNRNQLLSSSFLQGSSIEIVDEVKALVANRRLLTSTQNSDLSRWMFLMALLLLLIDQLFAYRSKAALGALTGLVLSGALASLSRQSPTVTILSILACTLLCSMLASSTTLRILGSLTISDKKI